MAAGDLTTLDAVKAWIGSDVGSSSDTLLASLITSASGWIIDYLSRNILTASYAEVRQGNGNASMTMRQYPITAVASVGWNGQSIVNLVDPLNLQPGFLFDGRRLDLIGYTFPYGCPVVVAYTAGYATAPAAIAQACNELVGEAFKRRDRIGMASKTLGGQETVSYSLKDMNETTRTDLNNYRNTVPV